MSRKYIDPNHCHEKRFYQEKKKQNGKSVVVMSLPSKMPKRCKCAERLFTEKGKKHTQTSKLAKLIIERRLKKQHIDNETY